MNCAHACMAQWRKDLVDPLLARLSGEDTTVTAKEHHYSFIHECS